MNYLCVDGGQTKTDVSLLDEEGRTIESWQEGSLTTPSKPGATDNLHDVIRSACGESKRRLESESAEPLQAACFSLTGYLEHYSGLATPVEEGGVRIPELVEKTARRYLPVVQTVHTIPDYVGNWAAATRGEPGIVLLSGGGTVAYGRNEAGDSLRVGGWGHLLGDEGSGYWIGLTAIKMALRSQAGILPKTELEMLLERRFRVEEDRQILEKTYSGTISDGEIADLVPLVDALAREGDAVASAILDEAADYLVKMGAAMLEGLGELPIHLSGGVFNSAGIEECFRRGLREAGYSTEVLSRSVEPAEGIFLIAKGEIARQ